MLTDVRARAVAVLLLGLANGAALAEPPASAAGAAGTAAAA